MRCIHVPVKYFNDMQIEAEELVKEYSFNARQVAARFAYKIALLGSALIASVYFLYACSNNPFPCKVLPWAFRFSAFRLGSQVADMIVEAEKKFYQR